MLGLLSGLTRHRGGAQMTDINVGRILPLLAASIDFSRDR